MGEVSFQLNNITGEGSAISLQTHFKFSAVTFFDKLSLNEDLFGNSFRETLCFCDQWKNVNHLFIYREKSIVEPINAIFRSESIQRKAYDTSIAIDGCGWFVIQTKITE